MKGQINTRAVLLEVIEDSDWIHIKRKKFVTAKVIQTGSEVRHLEKGDRVMCFNEGRTVEPGNKNVRVVNDEAIILKFIE